MGMGLQKSRGTRGISAGVEASIAGFPLGWKQMLRDSRGDEKYFTGFLRECIAVLVLRCS